MNRLIIVARLKRHTSPNLTNVVNRISPVRRSSRCFDKAGVAYDPKYLDSRTGYPVLDRPPKRDSFKRPRCIRTLDPSGGLERHC